MNKKTADRLFVGFFVACFIVVIAIGIGFSIWGGPTKGERISRLEDRVAKLEAKNGRR